MSGAKENKAHVKAVKCTFYHYERIPYLRFHVYLPVSAEPGR